MSITYQLERINTKPALTEVVFDGVSQKLLAKNASLTVNVRIVEFADVPISVRNSRVKRRDAMLRVSAEKVTG